MRSNSPAYSRTYRSLSFLALIVLVTMVSAPTGRAAQPGSATVDQSAAAGNANVPNGYLTGPAAGDAYDIAVQFIREHKATYKLSAADLADLAVMDRYVSKDTGVTHLYIRQRHAGIEVFNADINITVSKDGRIINWGSGFVPNLAAAINAKQPAISAQAAVQSAAQQLGLPLSRTPEPSKPASGNDRSGELTGGSVSHDAIPYKLMYQPVAGGKVQLSWSWSCARPPTATGLTSVWMP